MWRLPVRLSPPLVFREDQARVALELFEEVVAETVRAMSVRLDTLTFDCADVMRVARFWADALGRELDPESEPDGARVLDPSGGTGGLYFQPVPESKVAKNRLHIDLRPSGSMAAEVARLERLGATVVGRVDEEGSFWTVMQDPEGNELCVLRGPEDGWSPQG